jgi:hypothetical protein
VLDIESVIIYNVQAASRAIGAKDETLETDSKKNPAEAA